MYNELTDTYRRMWDTYDHQSIHSGYFDDDHDDIGAAAKNMTRIVAEAAGIDAETRVLDIGCGAGGDPVWLAENRGATVVGVNISEPHLDIAREHAWSNDVEESVTFRYDDFHELSTIDDDSVDVVWGLEALCHSRDDEKVLEEVQRVLADGGRIVAADWFVRPGALSPSQRRRLRKTDAALKQQTSALEEFETLLSDLGFRNVHVEDITDGVKPSAKYRYRLSFVAYPMNKLLSVLGKATDSHVAVARSSYHMYKLLQNEVTGFYIVTADV